MCDGKGVLSARWLKLEGRKAVVYSFMESSGAVMGLDGLTDSHKVLEGALQLWGGRIAKS